MTTTPKKRNPNDITLRNLRAQKKRLDKLEAEFLKMRSEVKACKAVIGQQVRER